MINLHHKLYMKIEYTFDLTDDWNYSLSSLKTGGDEAKPYSLPKSEFKGLKYDDLRGLSWTVLKESD